MKNLDLVHISSKVMNTVKYLDKFFYRIFMTFKIVAVVNSELSFFLISLHQNSFNIVVFV